MVKKPWPTVGRVSGDPPTMPPTPAPSVYNCKGSPEREQPRTTRGNKECCSFRPVRFGVTPNDMGKAAQIPHSSWVSVPPCRTQVGPSSSPWTVGISWGQGGQWPWPRAGSRERFPSWPRGAQWHHLRVRDHQVLGELSPGVHQAAPVQQVQGAAGGGGSAQWRQQLLHPAGRLYLWVLGSIGEPRPQTSPFPKRELPKPNPHRTRLSV